jgi:hypothetical protein
VRRKGEGAALKNTPASSARFNASGIFLIQYIGLLRGYVSLPGTVIKPFLTIAWFDLK